MLREVFRTVPFPYLEGRPTYPVNYLNPYYPPYLERLQSIQGLHVGRTPNTEQGIEGATSLYVWTQMYTAMWPGVGHGYARFDGKTGKLIRRVEGAPEIVASLIIMNRTMTSRKGVPYCINAFQDVLYKLTLGKTINEDLGDETSPIESWNTLAEGFGPGGVLQGVGGYAVSHFEGLSSFGLTAYDDAQDLFMNVQYTTMTVYNFMAGTIRYTVNFPLGVEAVALEERQNMYVLLTNRTILLFDYMRGEVLGASKLPPLPGGTGITASGIVIAHDYVYKRTLVAEPTPDTPAGASTTRIYGYRMVPEPTRITVPIPLRAPRQRRIIPVLVQVVGDANEGVGGYSLDARVTGSGSLVGIPLSDHVGNTLLSIACEGHEFFGGDPDWSSTGSPEAAPPHTGLVTIVATARVYTPPMADIPSSGVPGGGGTGGSGGFIWDWYDQTPTAPPPDAPGSPAGAPTDMASWEAYFFGLIKRQKGTNANDFNAVLMGLVNQGAKTNPASGEVPQESWPFFGIAIMVSGGEARGRIWLPTAVSYTHAGNTWYTHEIQVIKDAPVDPGGGGGGGGGTYGPNEMPNMFHIVEQVYNSKPAGFWKFDMGDEYDKHQPDGRGAFTALAVTAMHDVDARFGHFNKTAPHNGYFPSGGAVDAVCFKNDDGVSQEGADIVGSKIQWGAYDRSARTPDGDYNCWIYPGNPR